MRSFDDSSYRLLLQFIDPYFSGFADIFTHIIQS